MFQKRIVYDGLAADWCGGGFRQAPEQSGTIRNNNDNKQRRQKSGAVMEFQTAASMPFTANELQRYLRIDTLPLWCASIDRVLSHQGERGRIYCVWGEFAIHQEVLRDGVRFTLPGCPNALQWTITADGDRQAGRVVIHCTVNRTELDPDFAETLTRFVEDWKTGLEAWQEHMQALAAESTPTECAPWYG